MENNIRNTFSDFGKILIDMKTDGYISLIIATGGIAGTYSKIFLLMDKFSWINEYVRLFFLDTTVLVLAFIFYFFIAFLVVRKAGNTFVWLSEYYPDFLYLPKIKILTSVTNTDEIELTLINKKNQRFTLGVVYHLLESKVDPLPDQARGVSPDSKKQLLSLDTMVGKDKRKKKIGRVDKDKGIAILSAGDSNGEMILEKPGTYQYWVKWYGEFRGREYENEDKVTIRVTERSGVIIDS